MQYRRSIFFFVALCVFLLGSAGSAEAGTKLSDVINNFKLSWGDFHNLMSAFAWIAGAFLGMQAIFMFKNHVDNPQQVPLSYGVKRMIAGGMLLSLPFTSNAVIGNLFGAGYGVGTKITATGSTGAALTPGALDQIVVDVMKDIAVPMENLLTAFSYLAGIALLLVAVTRLTKRMEEGPKGPAGFGTVMTFIASGMLFNYGASMGTFATSIFGDNTLMTRVTIDPTVIDNTSGDADRIATVLEALEFFVLIVGYIAFIRGWFVMKNFADGQQGATLAQGLTFLIGGAVAINLGELVNAVQTTVGLNALTFG